MRALFIKELRSIFCSSSGVFFAVIYLLCCSSMLWLFPGSFNIPQTGYASLASFFGLSPVIFIILIPALTMRCFAEEKRTKTMDILMTRPVWLSNIYFSKFLAISLFILSTLIATTVYIYSLYQLANPVGNIDILSIIISYVSLYCIALTFTAIGLFTSSLSNNQIVALLLSILICFFAFYGINLLTDLFSSGKTQYFISSLGLNYHYNLMQRGVIEINNLVVVISYIIIFYALTIFSIKRSKKKLGKHILILLSFNIVFAFIPNIRFDFTSDQRYTLNDYSKKILAKLKNSNKKIFVNIYLEGELNTGFQHLRSATEELTCDLNKYSGNAFNVKYVNPYSGIENHSEYMPAHRMSGIILNETDGEGKVSPKTIYPYAQLISDSDTLTVSLLKNIPGYTAEENLNTSVENLEFEFIDAINILNQSKPRSIAFIEGHREWKQVYVYDAEELLSKYYTINRGQIGNNTADLNEFDAVIIAGSITQFSETEKYIIDQYIMNGGKILWMIDGAYFSEQDIAIDGYSASIKNNTNLDDMLFSYGVRINPDFVQDNQCTPIVIKTDKDKNAKPSLIPCYYKPVLIPSHDHPITRSIRDVKAEFASSIDIVKSSPDAEKKILLTTSENSHIVKVPEPISYEIDKIQSDPNYFDQSFIPVAVSLEGNFNSAFTNRLIPQDIISETKQSDKSEHTRMVVISSSRIILNELYGQGKETKVVPMGYDINSGEQFGNRDFIVNAVNWLTDSENRMELRVKQQNMHILNKKAVSENRNMYAAINIVVPILFILLMIGAFCVYRKKKYKK